MLPTKLAVQVAAVAGVLSIVALRAYMTRFEQERSGGPPHAVLSLSQDADKSTVLSRELLAVRRIPEAYVESRHIAASELERVLGTRLDVDARAGESLLWSDIAELGARSRNLATLVPPGMRAVTIAPRAVHAGKLVRPGDRVDVLLAEHSRVANAATRTLLQSVLVLAVGTHTGDPDAENSGSEARDLTLGVDLADAQRLVHAEARGELRVALRNPEDARIVDGIPPTTALIENTVAVPSTR